MEVPPLPTCYDSIIYYVEVWNLQANESNVSFWAVTEGTAQ